MSTTIQQNQLFTRAVRKVKCAAMVNSLTNSWQKWANEHSVKQETIHTGWMPDSLQEDGQKQKTEVKLLVNTHVVEAGSNDDASNKIRTGVVTRSFTPKGAECSGDLVSAMKEKIGSHRMANDNGKPFLGNVSPTRRRLCSSKTSGVLKAWSQRGNEESKLGSCSNSLDTENSGLGEDASLNDNSDCKNGPKEMEEKKHKSRTKIKIMTMGDLRRKWQHWSEQHVEGQKLNPFSEEFDYEHAMALRLQKSDAGYGRPKEGSKTAERAARAQKHIQREMEEMCYIIRDMGVKGKDGRISLTFGRLFDRYVKISDKVVGILLRCRKHSMVDFEGEMLWQRKDDNVIITLLE